ncbi:MAG: hypothetical protein M1840_001994 [Geoglossum simile]|nr:MAG: hypothetical protein M1840_001994 [Geoglossum simile]
MLPVRSLSTVFFSLTETKNRAFSNVVADSQFSAIGLVLMAILARVNRIICARDVDAESDNPGVVLEWRADEDLGEAVARDDGGQGIANRDLQGSGDVGGESPSHMGVAAAGAMARGVSTPKTKRKRHKTTNAIDDLFSAIL